MLSYVFLSGNWYGKWTAIDLYLAPWIRNLSVLLESAHWRLCHPLFLSTLFFFITLCYFLNCEEVLPEFCIDIDVFFLWVFYWSFVCSFLKDFKKVFWHINYYYYYYYYYCYYNFYYYYYYYFRLTPSSTAIARILEEEVVLSGYLVPAQVSLSTWPLHIQKCDYAHLFLTNAFVYHQSRRRSVFQGCTCVPRTTNPLMCRIRNTHRKKLSILH